MTDLQLSNLHQGTVDAERLTDERLKAIAGREDSKCKKISLIVMLIFCVIGVAICAALPAIIESVIRKTLEKNLIMETGLMSESSYNKFVNNSDEKIAYYIWNITNAREVLLYGDKPIAQEVGPINTIHWKYRFDINETVSDRLRYKQVDTYEVLDDGSREKLNLPVISINILYMGGMAALTRATYFNASNPAPHIAIAKNLDDTNFNAYIVGVQTLPTIASQFLDPQQTLLSSFRVLALPSYLQAAVQTISARLNISSQSVMGGWGTNTTFSALDPALVPFTGFNLPGVLSKPTSSIPLLWTPSATSLTKQNGLLLWLAVLPLADSPSKAQATPILKQANDLSDADFALVVNWLRLLTLPTNVYYQGVQMSVIQQGLSQVNFIKNNPDPTQYYPTNWAQLGALQWSTGLITTLLTQDPILISNGIATSVTDVDGLGAQAGLNGFYNHKEPMEFVSGSLFYQDKLLSMSTVPRLNIANATYVLSFFPAGDNNNAVKYVGLIRTLSAIVGNVSAYNPVVVAGTYQFLKANGFPGVPPPVATFLSNVLSSDASNAYSILVYLSRYLGSIFVGDRTNLDIAGVPPQNAGLLMRQTVGGMLFGYTNRIGSYPSISDTYFNASTFAAELPALKAAQDGLDYEYETGRASLQRVGMYKQYNGIPQFQYWCEYYDPVYKTQCSTPAKTVLTNWRVWGEPEVITGVRDGTRFPPFHEDAPVPYQEVFVSDVKRVGNFIYEREVDVKGITTRRYIVDPTTLNSTLTGGTSKWRNESRWYSGSALGTPDGMLDLTSVYGGVPIHVSYPHMLSVDPVESSKIIGFQPDKNIHESYLDTEPLTGLSFRIAKRLQAGFRLKKSMFNWNPNFFNDSQASIYSNIFKQYENVTIPYYWAAATGEISDDDASTFKDKIIKTRKIAFYLQRIGCAILSFFVVIIAFLLYRLKKDE